MGNFVHVAGYKLKDNTSKADIDQLNTAITMFKKSVPGVIDAYAAPFSLANWI